MSQGSENFVLKFGYSRTVLVGLGQSGLKNCGGPLVLGGGLGRAQDLPAPPRSALGWGEMTKLNLPLLLLVNPKKAPTSSPITGRPGVISLK